MKKPWRYYIGNLLIFISLSILVYTYFPFLKFFLPNTSRQVANGNFYINIPKISAIAPIFTNVDPWNESEYQQILHKGVAQAKGTSLPGQNGTIYLFAHSSLPPWEMTRTNTAFLRLGELQTGDKIMINMYGTEYDYVVKDKKELWPNDVQYLTKNNTNQLILQTCTPLGTSLKRLLIFAQPIKLSITE